MQELVEFWKNNELFQTYTFYTAILVIKMLSMSFLTMCYRMATKTSPNEEDKKYHGDDLKFSNSSIERIRRAHQNDIENIPIFIIISLLYLFTGPTVGNFLWLMRTYTIARVVFSISYVFQLQPYRTNAYLIGFFTTVYTSYKVVTY